MNATRRALVYYRDRVVPFLVAGLTIAYLLDRLT